MLVALPPQLVEFGVLSKNEIEHAMRLAHDLASRNEPVCLDPEFGGFRGGTAFASVPL